MTLIISTTAPNRPVISKVLPFYNSNSDQLTKVDVQVKYISNVKYSGVHMFKLYRIHCYWPLSQSCRRKVSTYQMVSVPR